MSKTEIILVWEVVKTKDCGNNRISFERMFELILKKERSMINLEVILHELWFRSVNSIEL